MSLNDKEIALQMTKSEQKPWRALLHSGYMYFVIVLLRNYQ